jgi:hypothetical protein
LQFTDSDTALTTIASRHVTASAENQDLASSESCVLNRSAALDIAIKATFFLTVDD